MAGENLKLMIVGTLNTGATIGEINAQLKGIEKKIEKLTLNIKIDDKISKTLSDFSKAMENHKKIAEDLNRVIREEKVVTKEADGVIREKIKQHLKSGEIIEKEIERINKKNKATQKEKEVTGQLIDELDKLGRKQKEITRQDGKGNPTGSSQKYRNNYTDTTYNANKNGQVTSIKTVENLDQERKATENLIVSKQKLREQLKLLANDEKITQSSLNRINTVINTSSDVAQLKKLEDALTRVNQRSNVNNVLDNYKRNAQIQANTLLNTHSKTLDNTALQAYLNSVKSLNATTPQLQHRMRQLALDFREVSGAARDSARSSMTVLDAFRTAMVKFPVWMAATTAFYGSLNALKSSISIIVDVDTRLTNLKKVMSEETDFARIMDTARVSAEQFGKTLSEVLDAYTEFARQGYKEQDLINLGDAGLITSNVGEMTSARAAEYLTSAMVQYNVATKDSMKIIDAWNNVSNKNATTVEKMAAGMAKAGATANAFGVDMNELNAMIGTVTAATKQSGNEVGNFLKSAMPRLLGQPGQDALKSLNIDFIDSKTGDMRKVVDIYGEVADKVKNISKVEKMAVMEGLAGKQHISRMTAMIDNWDMYKKMVDESRNSEGSAATENEKYMKSLQARIALMKVSLEEIALSFGKAFLTEGFVQALEVIKTLSHAFVGVSNVVGGLPLIFSAVGIAVMGLSKNLKIAVLDSTLLNAAFTKLNVTSKILKISLAALGAGAVLFGLGMGLEFLLKKQGEARERAEELERKNRELTDSYKEHREDIKTLTSEYSTLDNKIRNGKFGVDYNTEDIEKYKQLSNDIAKLMPELAQGEDQYGNKIIGSNEKIKSRIELLEKQTAIQEKLDAAKKKQKVEDEYDDSKKNLNSTKTGLDKFFLIEENPQAIMSVKELDASISKLQNKIAKGAKLSFGEKNELKNLQDLKDRYNGAVDAFDAAKLSYQKSTMNMIDNNVKLDESTSQTTKSMIDDFTTFVATSGASQGKIENVLDGVLNSVQNDKGFKETLEGYSSAFKTYQDTINKGANPTTIEKYRDEAVNAFDDVKTALMQLAVDGKIDPKMLNTLSAQMDGVANSALISAIDFDKLTKSTGKTKEELMANLLLAPQMEDMFLDTGDSAENAANSIQALVKAEMEKATVEEQMVGSTQSLIDQIKDQVTAYQMLSNMENLSAEQKVALGNATKFLSDMYPQFIKNGELNVEQMRRQVEAEDILLKAVQDVANGHADAEEIMTTNQALQSKARMEMMSAEITAYQKTMEAIEATYEETGMSGAKAYAYNNASTKIAGLQSEIEKLTGSYQVQVQKLAESTGYQGQYYKASEKSNKGTENSIYVSDKYKQALEKINAELAKYEAIQKKFPDYSDEFQDALKNEIKLLGQKKKLIEEQAKSLDKQIKSGNVQQYGIIKTDSETTSGSGSTTSSGSSGKVTGRYANEINSAAIANGISAGLIKAVATQESNLGKASSNVMQVNGYNGKGATASINKGAQMLANLLKKTGGNLEKALAAYNMGEGILSYFAKHGGYSVENMKAFSNLQKKKHGYKVYGDPNYVDHVLRYYTGGSNTDSVGSSGMDALITEARKQSKKGTFTYKQIGGEFTGTYDQFLKRALSDCSQFVQEFFQQFLGKNVPRTAATQWAAGKSVKDGQQQVGDLVFWNTTGKAHSHVGIYTGNGKAMQMGSKGLREIDISSYKGGKFEGYRRIPGAGTGTGSVTSTDSAEAAQNVDQAKSDLLQLQQDAIDVANQIQDLQLQLVQAKASSYDHKTALLQDDFAKIDLQMQRENEGTKAWTDLQLKKEKLMQQEKKNQQDAIAYIKDQIKNNKNLTAAQKQLLGDDVIDRTKELYSLEQQILTERQNMADKIIDTYKQALEAQKQAALDSIDKMLDEIDKKEAEADYNKELKKKQGSRQELTDELNSLMLDDSDAAKKRKDEIQKQLQESNEEIDDFQHSHEVDQRKTNLNDKKDQITKNYDDLLNDEQKFAKMRSDIINANSEQIKKDLQKYYDNIKANANVLGKALSSNLIDLINQANRYLNGKDYKPINVASMDTGGYTGSFSGGKYLLAHEKELILNKVDTSNLLKAIDITRNLVKNFPIPKLPTITPSMSTGGNTISINLNIDKMTGNQSDIDKLLGAVRTEFKRLGM